MLVSVTSSACDGQPERAVRRPSRLHRCRCRSHELAGGEWIEKCSVRRMAAFGAVGIAVAGEATEAYSWPSSTHGGAVDFLIPVVLFALLFVGMVVFWQGFHVGEPPNVEGAPGAFYGSVTRSRWT